MNATFSDGKKRLEFSSDKGFPFDMDKKIEEGVVHYGHMIISAYSQLSGKEICFSIKKNKIVFEKGIENTIKKPKNLFLTPERHSAYSLVSREIKEVLEFVLGLKELTFVNIFCWEIGYFLEVRESERRSKLQTIVGESVDVNNFEGRGSTMMTTSLREDFAVVSFSKWTNRMEIELEHGPFKSTIERSVEVLR